MQTSITEDEIREQGGIIYDPAKWNEAGKSSDTFPSAAGISDQIIEIYEYMLLDETKKLKEQLSEDDFSAHMEKKFRKFCDNYYAVFKMITSGGDITPLLGMLAEIDKNNSGQISYEETEKNVGQNLKDRFLPKHLQNEQGPQKGMRQYKQLNKSKKKKKN